jgi:hypothetical protein
MMMTQSEFHKKSQKNYPIKLSIITVVKGDEKGLATTLMSLNCLDLRKAEVVVWINANTDKLQEHIFTAIQYADTVISGSDTGIFDAMNRALDHAVGRFILFLNAKDKIIKPFSINDIDHPCVISVRYKNYFGLVRFVKVAKTKKLGIPYCHQGMILPRVGYNYNTRYKYGADYLALLDHNLPWPMQRLPVGLVEYDTTGVSTINRWESDRWTALVIKDQFGYFWSFLYLGKCLLKLSIKRIYDLKIRLMGNPPLG